MSNPSGSNGLEMTRSLLKLSREFATREAALLEEYETLRITSDRKYRLAAREVEVRQEARATEAESMHQMARSRLSGLYEGRRKKIQTLHAQTLRNLPKMVQNERSRWLGDLQARKRSAGKIRDEHWGRAEAAYQEVAGQVAEHSEPLRRLQKQAAVAFAGYGGFKKMLSAPATETPSELGATAMQKQVAAATEALGEFRAQLLPKIFKGLPLLAWLGISAGVGIVMAVVRGMDFQLGGIVAGAGVAISLVIYFLGRSSGAGSAGRLCQSLAAAGKIEADTLAKAQAEKDAIQQRAQESYTDFTTNMQGKWSEVDTVEKDFEQSVKSKLERQMPRMSAKNEDLFNRRSNALSEEFNLVTARNAEQLNLQQAHLKAAFDKEIADINARENTVWKALEDEWNNATAPMGRELAEFTETVSRKFPPWQANAAESWQAPLLFTPVVKFGEIQVDFTQPGPHRPAKLPLNFPADLRVPLTLNFPGRGNLFFANQQPCGGAVMDAFNNLVLRLISSAPPGKVAFTILDSVGLGKNFAGLMHLADYEETLINRRIWTQRSQMEERLAELNDHIEKVIQMYLRNEYATITEYNEQAGSVAEKYHFLVVADFPAGFSDTAAQRLQSILLSGPRCGVFTILHWDRRQHMPDGFSPEIFAGHGLLLEQNGDQFEADAEITASGAQLKLESPPPAETELALVHKIGKASIDSNRVEVPFSHISPSDAEIWSNETTNELRVSIGRTGATKQQYLAIGKGTKQHALFAGKTGSGKSTLFHVIITNLSMWCSPDEVEFYLIDFKKGVEFKCYASHRLPHAKVVAIESDREFGLSVLQRVDDELRRRGDLFRKLGVQDVPGYKKASPGSPMPRCLLLIDEFQEIFTEDDVIAQTASVLLDRIVRQGRAFGIHVLLGSQTLGGAYTLARTTLGQMVIRVALQCNEADAYLIMDDNNPAPRLLSRPGEGIYNDSAGAIEGNSPFQVVWLPDSVRDACLDKVSAKTKAAGNRWGAPIVFEGNAPAEITENPLLEQALAGKSELRGTSGRFWLGAPNSIKGPTEVVFQRQSGNHLLIVGQRDEAALSMLGYGLLALSGQHRQSGAEFYFLDQSPEGTSEANLLERIFRCVPNGLRVVRGHELAENMQRLGEELKARLNGERGGNPTPIFVFVSGLQKFKKLRQEDDFSFGGGDSDAANPAAILTQIINEGSAQGIHLVVTVDTFNNIGRWLSRKALTEFEMRVVFQMSANDSASLIDSPAAGTLGIHRALLYNEQQGSHETFRPYAPPENAWLETAAQQLKA